MDEKFLPGRRSLSPEAINAGALDGVQPENDYVSDFLIINYFGLETAETMHLTDHAVDQLKSISWAMSYVWDLGFTGTIYRHSYERMMGFCEEVFGVGLPGVAAFTVIKNLNLLPADLWAENVSYEDDDGEILSHDLDTIAELAEINNAFRSSSWQKLIGVTQIAARLSGGVGMGNLRNIREAEDFWDNYDSKTIADSYELLSSGVKSIEGALAALQHGIDIETIVAATNS